MTAAALDAEQDDLFQRQVDVHEHYAHRPSDGAAARAIGSRVRAVDGSVVLALHPSDAVRRVTIETAKARAARFDLRAWIVTVGHDVLTLGWAAGSKIAGRLRGRLASDGLSCTALQLMQSAPPPTAANPFRLLRVAADRKAKTPETLMIELAAAGDPAAAEAKPDPAPAGTATSSAMPKVNYPPPGLRVGATSSDGFVPLLEVIPGRGVVMRGKVNEVRRIVRRPPGSEPSDEQLMQAFLRTEAGKKERERIEQEAKDLKLEISSWSTVERSPGHRLVKLHWKLTNNKEIKLTRLNAMATLVPTPPQGDVASVWTELPALEKTTLAKGEPAIEKDYPVSLQDAGETPMLRLMIAAESDYGVVVARFVERTEGGG